MASDGFALLGRPSAYSIAASIKRGQRTQAKGTQLSHLGLSTKAAELLSPYPTHFSTVLACVFYPSGQLLLRRRFRYSTDLNGMDNMTDMRAIANWEILWSWLP
jgi:hypothetical protein